MAAWVTAVIIGIAYVLQTTLMHSVAIFGAMPDLVLIALFCYSIVEGKERGAMAGVLTGLFVDLMSGGAFGFHTLIYMYLGVAAGILGNHVFGKNALTAMMITCILSLLYGFVLAVSMYVSKTDRNIGYMLLQITLPSAVYNAVISFFVYLLFENMSRKVYQ